MRYTRTAKPVLIYGLGDVPTSFDPAKLTRLDMGHGRAWGIAELFFPKARAFDHELARGDACRLATADGTFFKGHVLDVRNAVVDGDDVSALTVYDIRWDMARTLVGQYGIGNLWTPGGGFAGVGLDIRFNPNGAGNRAHTKSDTSYLFDTTTVAESWTLKDMLEFILVWYYPAMNVPTAWPDRMLVEEPDVNVQGVPVPEAISTIVERAGLSWAPVYDEDEITLAFVGDPASAGEVTIDLPAADLRAPASDASDYSALDLRHEVSIRDAVDIVEVRSARRLVETTYTSHPTYYGKAPLLKRMETPPPGYAAGWYVDVTRYADYNLGKSLPAGSRPKPLSRQLITRIKDDATGYHEAGDLALLAGRGHVVLPEDTCFVMVDNNDREQLLSGLTIRLDDALILLDYDMKTTAASYTWDLHSTPPIELFITLVTEIEIPFCYLTAPTTYHVDESHPIRTVIERNDIVPLMRWNADHNLLALDYGGSPFAWETVEPDLDPDTGEPVLYVDIKERMKKVHDAYLAARGQPEVTIRARLLDIPVIPLGAKLLVSPAEPYLTGNEIVTGVTYNFDAGDHVTVSASNAMARVMAGEL